MNFWEQQPRKLVLFAALFVALLSAMLSGCATTSGGTAAEKDQIAAVTRAWADGMSRHDVDAVVALYDSQAILWGTRSAKLRDTPASVREYFEILKKVPPSYKATLGEQHIRVFGDVAIDTGSYTFSEVRDGKEILRPARFSMVFLNRDGRWLIIDHHSSAVPAP